MWFLIVFFKVMNNARAFNLDGREFIRESVLQAYDNPLPPYIPHKSLSERKKEARLRKQDNKKIPEKGALDTEKPPRNKVTQFVMNLPDSAITFLDAFRGLLSPEHIGQRDLSGVYDENNLPMVHCYCFTKVFEADKAAVDIRQVSPL